MPKISDVFIIGAAGFGLEVKMSSIGSAFGAAGFGFDMKMSSIGSDFAAYGLGCVPKTFIDPSGAGAGFVVVIGAPKMSSEVIGGLAGFGLAVALEEAPKMSSEVIERLACCCLGFAVELGVDPKISLVLIPLPVSGFGFEASPNGLSVSIAFLLFPNDEDGWYVLKFLITLIMKSHSLFFKSPSIT